MNRLKKNMWKETLEIKTFIPGDSPEKSKGKSKVILTSVLLLKFIFICA